MNRKMSKRQRDIKSKLMAAICMLLVSSIMMVSTTYAWFTLSTAPEVTGINTAVGANGNLEMALVPTDGDANAITSNDGDSNKPLVERNITWGNLVDLSDNDSYGLDKIVLYPSELNVQDNKIQAAPLNTPSYGADGRVAELKDNTLTSSYTNGSFGVNETKGVRAVGVSSGMTQRELDYRNGRSMAASYMSSASTKAAATLNGNGTALASIAVKYGLNSEATFSGTDVAYLGSMITDLEAALAQIDKAYMQYILAFAASKDIPEAVYTTVKDDVEKSADLAALLTAINGIAAEIDGATFELPDQIETGIEKYQDAKANVDQAREDYDEINVNDEGTYAWSDIGSVVSALANPSNMMVNNYTIQQIKEDQQPLVDAVTGGQGVTVQVPTGAGIFADIADQSGDYEAMVDVKGVEYGSLVLNTKAKMKTETTIKPSYLTQVGNLLTSNLAPAGAADADKTLSEMYGYIIDLAFRTNAADSKLQLQVDAVDRIYSDQTGAETMGHGSTMTFEPTTTDLSTEQLKDLMGAVRVVFFDPTDENRIVANAKLDTDNAEPTANGLTAKMYLYTTEATDQYVQQNYDANKTGVTYYTQSQQDVFNAVTPDAWASNLYTDNTGATPVAEENFTKGETYYSKTTKNVYTEVDDATAAAAQPGTLYVKGATTTTEHKLGETALIDLTQNQPTALSVLVYLDGSTVTNGSVAATGTTSMTGSMNLQFSSSATLQPMEYKALHQGTATGGAEQGGANAEQGNAEQGQNP